MKKFTTAETRAFYNQEDVIYRSFWDRKGNCHWGYFPCRGTPFGRAMRVHSQRMLTLASITSGARVLDLGCGNGVNSYFLHRKTGCFVEGVDLSDARIASAERVYRAAERGNVRDFLRFSQGSAEHLSFPDASFTHMWSQSTLYHVHNKNRALREVYRVLHQNGIFVFDDLIRPNRTVSREAERYVYERLKFTTNFSFVGYQQALARVGFNVLYAEDLSYHFALSYWKLADRLEQFLAQGKYPQYHATYRRLIKAYRKTWNLVERGDVGWALYLCHKPFGGGKL